MPSSAGKKSNLDRKSTRLNSSHTIISYAAFCLKKTLTDKLTPPHAPGALPPSVDPDATGGGGGGLARGRERRGDAGWGGTDGVAIFFLRIGRPPGATLPPYPPIL